MEFQSPFVQRASSYIRRCRVSLIGPRTKSWRGWRVHVETSRMAGESDASALRDDLLWPRSNNEKHPCSADFCGFFNRYSFIRIRLLPFVNMKCILCIHSVLSSLMLLCSLSPFSHYYTVRLTLRGLRACDDVSTPPLKTLHAHPRVTTTRRRCLWLMRWGSLIVPRMRLLNAFVYVIMAASTRTASVFIRMTIIVVT